MKKEFDHEERQPLSIDELLKDLHIAEELGYGYLYGEFYDEEICSKLIEKGYSVYFIIQFFEEDSYTCIPLNEDEKKGEVIVIREFLIEEMLNVILEDEIDKLDDFKNPEEEEK